jgi:hypothetical protein
MATDIARPVDLTSLLREKIQAEFLKLIPEATWDTLIEKEWKDYFNPTKERWSDAPSPFERQMKHLMEAGIKERLKKTIDEKLSLMDCDEAAKEFMVHVAKESGPGMLNAFFENIIRIAAGQMSDQLSLDMTEHLRQHHPGY